MKNYNDITIGQWRWGQRLCILCIIGFFLYMKYPFWDILVLSSLILILTTATHIKQTATGMILKTLQNVSNRRASKELIEWVKKESSDWKMVKNIDKDLPN